MRWRIEARAETGSTNSDVIEAARAGAEEGLVITADAQTSGRGRLGRTWISAPGASLALSMLLRPIVPVARWGWLPLLAGVALADAIDDHIEVGRKGLKWPNDLLIDGRKCAGILAEAAVPGTVVIGVGVNLTEAPPGFDATSLKESGASTVDIVEPLLARFADVYQAWQGGADVRELYVSRCSTIGKSVRVMLPGGAQLVGEATTVDSDGRLVIRDASGELCPIAAGDVTHVR